MSTRCESDTLSVPISRSLGRGSYKGCGSDGDVWMVFSGFVAPVDVDG